MQTENKKAVKIKKQDLSCLEKITTTEYIHDEVVMEPLFYCPNFVIKILYFID